MRKIMRNLVIILISSVAVFGCASSIVDSESVATKTATYAPKPADAEIGIFMAGTVPDRSAVIIGKVTARAYVLETGINALKVEARKIGADAITGITYERRFSMNYLEDLFFIDGNAVVFKPEE